MMRAIVTGAASGIGRAVAHRLNADSIAREGRGAQLTLADIAAEPLAAAAAALIAEGAEVTTLAADLADPAVSQQIVDLAAHTYGGVDTLISNAGLLRSGSLLDLSLEDYELTFAVNTRPTWLLIRAVRAHLRESQGSVVVTTSIAAHHPIPAQGAYSASKAALLMMARQLACELGPEGIRINTVSPGATLTGIGGGVKIDPAVTERGGPEKNRNPLGFISWPEDQAAAIAFLAGPDARFITGSDLGVDGGVRTQLMVKSGHPLPPS
ncbi:MAG: SDR family oxidoreductase [Sphingomonadales bacterium]|nr:MAG: SDR family oxidoreductase [Sphingomonadales bacterium]